MSTKITDKNIESLKAFFDSKDGFDGVTVEWKHSVVKYLFEELVRLHEENKKLLSDVEITRLKEHL